MRGIVLAGLLLTSISLFAAPARAGTTIISHGFTPFATSPPDWTLTLAEAIVAAAGDATACGSLAGTSLGTVFVYDAPDGTWDLHCGSTTPNGEIVLVFNWSRESDGFNLGGTQGFAEGAGDALYAALRDPWFPVAFAGVDPLAGPVHFIGHSRGAVVNSDCVERLAVAGIPVDQVTTLDPHPVDGSLDLGVGDWGDRTPLTWTNVDFSDNYWRADGGGFPASADFDGMPIGSDLELDLGGAIEGAFDIDPVFEHTEVHAWYHGTIDLSANDDGDGTAIDDELFTDWWNDGGVPARNQTGFHFSAVRGGTRPPPLPGSAPTWPELSIYNGDFETVNDDIANLGIGYAGWLYHGGDKSGVLTPWASADPPPGSSYYLSLEPGADTESLTHNRLHVDVGVGGLALSRRIATASPNDHLRITLTDGLVAHTVVDASLATTSNWEALSFPISPALVGHTYLLQLELDGGGDGVEASVDLDDLHFVPEPSAPTLWAFGIAGLLALAKLRRSSSP
jgi:hypothetical protein